MLNFLKEAELSASKYLAEAGLDYGHNKKGETKFTKTDGSESYVQDIIDRYAAAKGIKKAEAQKVFDAKVTKIKDSMGKLPKLNATMVDNVAETVAFELLEDTPMDDVKFSKRIFQQLFQEVKSEVPEFYPLSNVFEPKRIEPTLWYAPDKLAPEFNGIGTAACTPDAKLIFNVPFMEKLMKFATLKGIKADMTKLHGKKYVSQGGNIPDSYLYCEFVLLHEIMHYGNGDFYFEKAYNLNGNIVNYVGDFVTNYNLVKSGYAQLPIGLFNDDINYDRYNSYQQMYDVIEEELNKLPKNEQEDMMDQLDKMGDEMPKNGEGTQPNQTPQQKQKGQQGQQGQQGKEGEKQAGEGEGQGGQGQGQEGDQQGQQGQGGGQGGGEKSDKKDGEGSGSGDEETDEKSDKKGGSGKDSAEEKAEQKKREDAAKAEMEDQKKRAEEQKQGEKDGKTSGTAPSDQGKPKGKVPSSIDDAIRKNANQMNDAQKDTGRETKTGMNKDAMKPGQIADMMAGNNNGSGKNSADGNPYELGEKKYEPKLNWKQMLKKMVPSGEESTETYSKPSRRTTSSMVSVAQTGSGVVKPGMKKIDSEKKGLCFILDNSGSTMSAIGEIQDDIMNLIKKEADKINNEMYVMKFSNDVHYFRIDIKKKKYGRITDVADFIKTGRSNATCDQPIASLFKTSYGGGTELTAKITMAARTLFELNFNVVLFSDSDISGGENANQLKQIYNNGRKQFALIGCSKSDYKSFVDILGNKGNITYYPTKGRS